MRYLSGYEYDLAAHTRTPVDPETRAPLGEPEPIPDHEVEMWAAQVAFEAARDAANAVQAKADADAAALTGALTRALVTVRKFTAMPPGPDRDAYFHTAYPDVRAVMATYLATPVEARTPEAIGLYDVLSANVQEIAMTAATTALAALQAVQAPEVTP